MTRISETLRAAVQAAGGRVHSDGNIFFTGANEFLAAAAAFRPQSAPTEAGGVAEPSTREHDIALREGHQIRACEDYFSARPKNFHTTSTVTAFEAGYKRAWDDRGALSTLPAPSPAAGAGVAALDAQANSIMGLVDTLVASMNEAHLAKSDDWRQACFQAADNTIEGIRAALSATQVAAVAQPVAMTRAEVDRIVYACRQSGDDSTYAIVNAALAASPSGERQDVGGDRG